MHHHDGSCSALAERADGRERLVDASIIDDATVSHGNVEVLAKQDPPSPQVGVVDRYLGHKRAAMCPARSTTRQE